MAKKISEIVPYITKMQQIYEISVDGNSTEINPKDIQEMTNDHYIRMNDTEFFKKWGNKLHTPKYDFDEASGNYDELRFPLTYYMTTQDGGEVAMDFWDWRESDGEPAVMEESPQAEEIEEVLRYSENWDMDIDELMATVNKGVQSCMNKAEIMKKQNKQEKARKDEMLYPKETKDQEISDFARVKSAEDLNPKKFSLEGKDIEKRLGNLMDNYYFVFKPETFSVDSEYAEEIYAELYSVGWLGIGKYPRTFNFRFELYDFENDEDVVEEDKIIRNGEQDTLADLGVIRLEPKKVVKGKEGYTVDDVRKAEITLEPMICKHCGSKEVVYEQYVDRATCQECGKDQDEKVKKCKKVKADDGQENEPHEDDAFIYDSGSLGSKTSWSVEQKFMGEYDSEEEVEKAIKEWTEKHNFFPSVWYVSDHGNVSPYSITADKKGENTTNIKEIIKVIDGYAEGLASEQQRDYGDLNIDIKIHGLGLDTDDIKAKYPDATDDMISQIWFDEANIYINSMVEEVKDKYGWEAGVEGRSGGWFYVTGIQSDLEALKEELENVEDYDNANQNEVKRVCKEVKDKARNITKSVTAIENLVGDTVRGFTSEVNSMSFWDTMLGK